MLQQQVGSNRLDSMCSARVITSGELDLTKEETMLIDTVQYYISIPLLVSSEFQLSWHELTILTEVTH